LQLRRHGVTDVAALAFGGICDGRFVYPLAGYSPLALGFRIPLGASRTRLSGRGPVEINEGDPKQFRRAIRRQIWRGLPWSSEPFLSI